MPQHPEQIPPESALYQALRAELGTVRLEFYALLADLQPGDWERPSLNPAWTNGELLWHITDYLFLIPEQLIWLQTRSFPDLTQRPPDVLNEENVRFTRAQARTQSIASIAQTYDQGHAATLAALATVQDHEWALGVLMPDMGPTFSGEYRTVETLFRYHARHFAEHAVEVSD
jgi:hypothetical protein